MAAITTEQRIGLHEMTRRFETSSHDGMFCHRNRDVLESRAAAATVTDDTSNMLATLLANERTRLTTHANERTNKADDTCK